MPGTYPFDSFRSPWFLPERHSQSIYPALWRQVAVPAPRRERWELPDGDFLDLDFYTPHPLDQAPMLLISHGLEGSSSRPYVQGLVKAYLAEGGNALAWNYRSCSGPLNRLPQFYHSGAWADLAHLIAQLPGLGVQTLDLAGFSLGGNLSLKYLGDMGENTPSIIRKAVVFSVPLHLSSSSKQLGKKANVLYTQRFLKTLKAKVLSKLAMYPDHPVLARVHQVQTLWEFDECITGPLHGFEGAEHYYQSCSAGFVLPAIQVPSLVVNARNDPFLSEECFPQGNAWDLPQIYWNLPSAGGHCGFYAPDAQGSLWSERLAVDWLMKQD